METTLDTTAIADEALDAIDNQKRLPSLSARTGWTSLVRTA
jgi:hypothetical protein